MKINHFVFICLTALLAACSSEPPKQELEKQELMKEATANETSYPLTEIPVKILAKAEALLGEGPIWDGAHNRLLWVDIEGQLLHVFNAETGNEHSWDMDARIGTVVPSTNKSEVVVALQNGIYCFNIETEAKTLIAHPEDGVANIRYNDGKASPEGCFWVGSMELDQKPEAASLYCILPDGSSKKALGGVTISNGIVWSADAKTMYYIDTYTQKVVSYDYDVKTHEISNPKTAIEVPKDLGSPDGMAIDVNGMLWIGMWGGSSVTCWDPKTGKLIDRIAVPALNVTACAFGGKDMETLYITTARTGMTEQELEKHPLSGSLFSLEPGVKGQATAIFAGCK